MKRALIVDDDADMVAFVSAVLEMAGYEVTSALGAREAIGLLRGRCFDIAILDMMMEEADSGVQIARELRRNPQTARTPVLLLTAVADKTGFRVALETDEEREWLSADVWLDKPVDPTRLLHEVARVTGEAERDRG
jgi:CheY-like chemotaxis protein